MFAGCATDDSDDADDAQTETVASDEAAESSQAAKDEVSEMPDEDADLRDIAFPVAAQDAIDTATDETGAGDVYAIELDHDSDEAAWVYSVKILAEGSGDEHDEHKVLIDPMDGEVVNQETEQTSDSEEAIDLDNPMTWDDALDKATQETNDALRGWKYEWDDGQFQYQFDFGSVDETTEVTVNAESGQVTQD